eukprot:jgi/Chlat1/4419/Chrsp29S04625
MARIKCLSRPRVAEHVDDPIKDAATLAAKALAKQVFEGDMLRQIIAALSEKDRAQVRSVSTHSGRQQLMMLTRSITNGHGHRIPGCSLT